jgi:hypothetical protein
MEEIKTHERHLVLNNYKTFDELDLFYWYDRFTKRLNYLKPLLIELESKDMKLQDVCKSLAQEVWEVTELVKFLEQFKIYLCNEKI